MQTGISRFSGRSIKRSAAALFKGVLDRRPGASPMECETEPGLSRVPQVRHEIRGEKPSRSRLWPREAA